MQIAGHHILKQYRISSACGLEGKPAAERACSDNGDVRHDFF
jgi:hypothetical protein